MLKSSPKIYLSRLQHLLFLACVIFLGFWIGGKTWAYIPKSDTILSKLTSHSGRGTYIIEQDLIYKDNDGTLFKIREKWTIESENSMRLLVVGPKGTPAECQFVILYKNGRKYWLNTDGQVQSKKLSPNAFETYFHYRNAGNLRNRLIQMGMIYAYSKQEAIADAKAKRNAQNEESKKSGPLYVPEPFVNLARVDGHISFAVGRPTSMTDANPKPAFFVDQNAFVIRRLRLPSGAEIAADSYQEHRNDLHFPGLRKIRWQNQEFNLQLKNVEHRVSKNLARRHLSLNSFKEVKFGKKVQSLNPIVYPKTSQILEFYQSLR